MKLRSYAVLACALAGGIVWSGCRPAPQREEIIGRYVMNKGNARDEIVLYPTSLYVHSYMPVGAQMVVDSGQWQFDSAGRLVLTNFTMRARNETFPQAPQPTSTWLVEVERTIRGRFKLNVDDDLGWYYLKTEARP